MAEQRSPIFQEALNGTGSTIVAFMCVTGARTAITLAAGITSVVYGFTDRDIEDGKFGDVQVSGTAICTAGAAGFTAGDRLMPEAGGTGKMVTWSAGAGANATIAGIAETTATANKTGEIRIGAGSLAQGA